MKHFGLDGHHDAWLSRGGPHEHRGRGFRGGSGKFFESGNLRYVILHLIHDTPRHGYETIKLIENRMAGAHSPSPGIIYPTLTMMVETGLAAVTVEGTRKLYSITEQGTRELQANRTTTDAILQRMDHAGERHTRDNPGPIVRAIENLKMVLQMRGNEWSQEQVAAVTDIIDRRRQTNRAALNLPWEILTPYRHRQRSDCRASAAMIQYRTV
jgi:DNA-binding PadR family transcriptional regulator